MSPNCQIKCSTFTLFVCVYIQLGVYGEHEPDLHLYTCLGCLAEGIDEALMQLRRQQVRGVAIVGVANTLHR